jgi:hypothetical protein
MMLAGALGGRAVSALLGEQAIPIGSAVTIIKKASLKEARLM